MTHCKEHRTPFLAAGKMLETSSTEELAEYFCLQQEKDLANRTISKTAYAREERKARRHEKHAHDDDGYSRRPKKKTQ